MRTMAAEHHLLVVVVVALAVTSPARSRPNIVSPEPYQYQRTKDPAKASREEIPFDFNWRFKGYYKPQAPATSCPSDAFPLNRSGWGCVGLSRDQNADSSAADCRKACCTNPYCAIWQWLSLNTSQSGGCWMGSATCNPGHNSWVGQARTTVPQGPPPPPAPTDHPPQTSKSFNDSAWELVQVPHDFTIGYTADPNMCPSGCSGHSYIPRDNGWYRKRFVMPMDWKGSVVSVHFEGIFRYAMIYLNGELLATHDCAYTSFDVRLDNASSITFGAGLPNVLTVWTDAIHGSGWWYEGGGLYRHVKLVKTSPVHVETFGVFVSSTVDASAIAVPKDNGDDTDHGATCLTATKAVVNASATVRNDGVLPMPVCVQHTVYAPGDVPVASGKSDAITIARDAATTITLLLVVSDAQLWAIRRPFLYTLTTEVLNCSTNPQATLDSTNTSFGIRSARFEPDTGFLLNNQAIKIRGFCNHNDFAVMGMAVADRVNLFRAQMMRSVGGQGWRMSHNPPIPMLLDILDRVGIVVMDENRLFGNSTGYFYNMGELVKRDRNHASVVIWSFCNEAGCQDASGGPGFRHVTYEYDGTRPTLANMIGDYGNLLTNSTDVQGFSHKSRSLIDQFHASFPHKPEFMSECCSCTTERGINTASEDHDSSFNAPCLEQQTNSSTGVPYVAGTMVWTLQDYYGEPSFGGWPHVSSSFGAFDLAGFAKAGAKWFRSWWLHNVPDTSPDKPFSTGNRHVLHVVEDWDKPTVSPPANKTFVLPCNSIPPSRSLSFTGNVTTAGQLVHHPTSLCVSAVCNCSNLNLVACDAASSEQWFWYNKTQQRTTAPFVSVATGQCLDVWDSGQGPNVGIYTCDGRDTQSWDIVPEQIRLGDNSGRCLTNDIQPADGNVTVNVYSDMPQVALTANGVDLPAQPLRSPGSGGPSWASFSVPYSPGSITAKALDEQGRAVLQQTVRTSSSPHAILLSLDAPNNATGTGSKLLLDGQDVALVRATVVDTNNQTVARATNRVTFSVVDGPGRVIGAHNGDPTCHENNHSPSHPAFHGLVRAVIMVTLDASSPPWQRRRLLEVEVETDGLTRVLHPDDDGAASVHSTLVVQATSPGLAAAQLSIPLSTIANVDGVLAVASRPASPVV
eukprot:m.154057 g.154057  ORF g.154057 m.154057 type:complete len:1133 (+) comp17490_c0_seq1:41-3439(+)